MTPDEQYNQKLAQREQEKLSKIEKSLTPKDIEKIINDNKTLKEEQNLVDDQESAKILPSVKVSDIAREVERVKFVKQSYKDIPIHYTAQPTNGLTFIRMRSKLGEFPLFIRQYIDIFQNIFSKIGSKNKKYEEMNKLLNLYTTGFGVDYDSVSDLNSVDSQPNNYLMFSIAGLDRNIDKMFELFGEMLTGIFFRFFNFELLFLNLVILLFCIFANYYS